MKTLPLTMIAVATVLATWHGAEAQNQYTVENLGTGLIDHDVYALAWHGTSIYAAADSSGVYVYEQDSMGTGDWRNVGLKGIRCREIAVDPTDGNTILAGTLPHGVAGTVIYRTTDAGATWAPSDSGLTPEERSPARALPSKARLRFHPTDPSRVIATGIAHSPHLSTDGGSTWHKLGGGVFDFTTINDVVWSPDRDGLMFAGGESAALSAVLFRSTDNGRTWTQVLDIPPIELQGENAIDGIAISPKSPNVVVAGTEGFVVRTTDMGEHWTKAYPDRLPYYMMSPEWDHTSPDRAFIGGGNALTSGKGIVMVSEDRGSNWEVIARDEWCTLERGITTPAFPASFIFSAARAADFPDQASLPRGVYIIHPAGSSGAPIPQSRRSMIWLE